VLRAFGAAGEPERLAGGQGESWRVGDIVVKRVGLVAETEWVADVLEAWPAGGRVRVPGPVRAIDGSWVHAGWAAHRWLVGRDVLVPGEIGLVREASDAFHAVTADLRRPAFLDVRYDPWSQGDRVAWEGAEPEGSDPTRQLVREATAAYEPVAAAPQVVHGDIGGNVLVAQGLPPAVIDWPPYFRPAAFALAVAAVDAICWSGASVRLLHDWGDQPEWRQILLRAFVYRTATHGRFEALRMAASSGEDYVRDCRPCLDSIVSLAD
jgi:uncharacterized protein (TIGR02569 family)